jgi:ribonuclease HI
MIGHGFRAAAPDLSVCRPRCTRRDSGLARARRIEGFPRHQDGATVSFVVYSDGSGTTGGPAGIGFVVLADGLPFSEGSLPLANATNQQAEILAAAYALHSLPEGQDVVLYSDSKYVVNGFTEYLPKWSERGWRRSGGPLANLRHWQRLLDAVERHRSVRFEWTPGHVGTEGNERADRLAGAARARSKGAAAK